jgi:hypothetical protein
MNFTTKPTSRCFLPLPQAFPVLLLRSILVSVWPGSVSLEQKEEESQATRHSERESGMRETHWAREFHTVLYSTEVYEGRCCRRLAWIRLDYNRLD